MALWIIVRHQWLKFTDVSVHLIGPIIWVSQEWLV
jgi:hypothetical protein